MTERRGIILVASDPVTVAIVGGLVPAELGAPVERSNVAACAARCTGSRRRQLLVLQAEPRGRATSCVIEAIRVVDPELPIVVVRRGRARTSPRDHVHVVGIRPLFQLILELLTRG